ncbi:methyltransferase, FxLD system [Haloechinothrix halophila]|uniref:methyltransferase, FxLD system n=1 Tax=Haloechinothrix halophila TaxID=1069073 RepID=UPI000A014569|nr:methyltransferase, FxLD system [Haloechinothrix halophila]
MTLNVDTSVNALREAMVAELRKLGAITSDRVADAMGAVPRHAFVPGEPLKEVYHPTRAIVTKRDASGSALSSLSEAHIQAAMLEQAQVEPGMRVLEVGSGGYNAALIGELVGASGHVTSVDIDPDIVLRAEQYLAAAGYKQIDVVQADAEHGAPANAPYDRIIVTAGAWDIPPAWSDQLTVGGRVVVPLRMRGLTRSVAFEDDGERLVSHGYRLCGFVPMQGTSAHTEQLIELDEGRVGLRVDGSRATDGNALRAALFGSRVERWSGVEVGGVEPVDDMDLWLATVADDFGLLTATAEAIDSGLVARSARMGAKAIFTDESFAYRAAARPVDTDGTRFEFGVIAHGPEADALAEEYIEQVRAWDRNHRGGPGARIEVFPATTSDDALPSGRVIDKQHTRVVISWPR